MSSPVTISERAARRIGQILKGEGGGAMLRISVEGGGCSGFQYGMSLEGAKNDDDTVLEYGAVTLLVDPLSAPLLEGVTVDFVDSLTGSGFKFENPNASSSCACGSSFSA